MEKITKYQIESARILFEAIEKKPDDIINPAHLKPIYRNWQNDISELQKWAKEEYTVFLNLCENEDARQSLKTLIQEPSNLDSIISNITAFIALCAVVPTPDYKQFTIYDDPDQKIINIIGLYSQAFKTAKKAYSAEAYKAGADITTAQIPANATNTNNTKTGNTAQNQNIGQASYINLKPITATDCMTYIPRKYIIDELIEDETITLFSGKEKIGKTYVLMDMALHMASEKPWLGYQTMSDAKGGILWLNLDMSRSTAQRRINEISNGIEKGWNIKNPHLFDNFSLMDGQVFRDAGYTDSIQFFSDSDAVEGLKEYIIANNIKVCFIDNLIQVEGAAQENSSNDIQKVFNKLKQLRDETHCSFIVIHHTTKDGGRGRGSSDIFGETDLNLQLNQCQNKDQLLLNTDGARNTATKDIGMEKKFLYRTDEYNNPVYDANDHPIYDFQLESIDTDGLISNDSNKTAKGKNSATIEMNITKILLWFHKTGNNTPLTVYGIYTGCNKDAECKLTGNKQTWIDSIKKAHMDGKLVKNSADQYFLADNKK